VGVQPSAEQGGKEAPHGWQRINGSGEEGRRARNHHREPKKYQDSLTRYEKRQGYGNQVWDKPNVWHVHVIRKTAAAS